MKNKYDGLFTQKTTKENKAYLKSLTEGAKKARIVTVHEYSRGENSGVKEHSRSLPSSRS